MLDRGKPEDIWVAFSFAGEQRRRYPAARLFFAQLKLGTNIEKALCPFEFPFQ